MEPGVRIVVATGIVAGGATLACVFPTVQVKDGAESSAAPIHAIERREPAAPYVRLARRPTLSTQAVRGAKSPSAPKSNPPKTAEAPPEIVRKELPAMAKSFPKVPASPEESSDFLYRSKALTRREVTTHRVVDGDSLSDLALRYLGDAARYQEILDANRDVLTSPDLLPIGARLRIPPHQ